MDPTAILLDGEFKEAETSFELIARVLKKNQELCNMTTEELIETLEEYGKRLLKSEARHIEGVAFFSSWLRRSNIENLIKVNLGNKSVLEGFVPFNGGYIKAQPRGIVCHWVAGNVPTLSMFSLLQSIIAGNTNIMRIPKNAIENFSAMMKVLKEVKLNGRSTGEMIVKKTSAVHFPSSERELTEKMSALADARVIWGGHDAVTAISSIKKRTHCEDIVFGPKYSFAVVDRHYSNSEELRDIVRRFVNDIKSFDQNACSSPHVIFFEANMEKLADIGNIFAEELRKNEPKTLPGDISNILIKRAEYSMDTRKKAIFPENFKWGIFIDDEKKLEEPLCNSSIFLKSVGSIEEVLDLINPRIQTIGCAIKNLEDFLDFSNKAGFRGISRLTAPGQMNLYDSPWDGMMVLERLIRWVSADFKD